MAKKKPTKSNVVSDFKPGDSPHYEYDGTVLNANVPWNELVQELEAQGLTPTKIARYAECSVNTIKAIVKGKYDSLRFRSGARIITLHSRYFSSAV